MKEQVLGTLLWIGDEDSCLDFEGPVIHACKFPCYERVIGEPREKDDPEYLVVESDRDLFLNMIDPPVPLFQLRTFTAALEFLDRFDSEEVLVHCNQGASRSPSIALLWLAKRRWASPDFASARAAFEPRFPGWGGIAYRPGAGISTFLEREWANIS